MLDDEGHGAGGVGHLLNDSDPLWKVRFGEAVKVTNSRVLVPGVLALVHSTFEHPGIARTTLLVSGKCSWPKLTRDVRDYVASSCCRRKKPFVS